MLDLLIRNGLIVDGTGSAGYYGAVGVEGDSVHVLLGDVSQVEAGRVIDATGHVVCPGFIDLHSHGGLVILGEPRHEPKVRQGVTTELIGIDGNSVAPFKTQQDLHDFIELDAGLNGKPPMPAQWASVADYLGMFDKKVAVNICYILGNSPVRIWSLGWDQRPATGAEIANMRSVVREAMEEGAFGLSTGLDYPPGSYADTPELTELCQEVARLGGIYHTHVRYSLGDRFLDPFKEAVEIAGDSEVALHITHFAQRVDNPAGARRLLEYVEDQRERGMDLTFDTFPYLVGSTRLLIMLPQWTHDGGPAKLKAVLRSEEARERLRKEVRARTSWDEIWLTYLEQPQNRQYEGRSMADIAEMMNKGVVDAMCDLLLEENLQISFTGTSRNGPTVPMFMAHPLCMVGSDAVMVGEFPNPHTYGTFPHILSEYVREERWLSLPEAIRKMTSFAAQRLGLQDRGILRDGMKADIVVFDADRIKAPATRHDPKQFAVGIPYVIVNGELVIDNGEHSGALPGRALRRGRRE